ncbi:putative Tubulin/FtsZ family, GTPase domain containing protein [Trypanosoma cruzi]|uniref:Putative Tubulin/FtsZ family, GTPase domain containing protein n=1 Tax=Trypanosoma cruzi TaxID=5693 RepID=A0A2V2WVP0_TRYCR|nr:putative Tubulin/FtsZ family, GTPase domain containing protein [Trypanosoma cruzi]
MSDAQNRRRSKIHEAMRIIRHRYQMRRSKCQIVPPIRLQQRSGSAGHLNVVPGCAVLFDRDEAKCLLPIRYARRGERRRTNGSEGHQMEPFTWLPAERYFHPLLNSIGTYQRYNYRLRAVCDARRQKLLLSGDIEQHPGPIAVLQMSVSCLTPSKLATLMAQGADIIPSRRLGSRQSRSPACTLEIMCSMHSRASAREAVWRCWSGKLSAPSVYLSPSPSMTPALKWWWSRLLWTRTVILL